MAAALLGARDLLPVRVVAVAAQALDHGEVRCELRHLVAKVVELALLALAVPLLRRHAVRDARRRRLFLDRAVCRKVTRQRLFGKVEERLRQQRRDPSVVVVQESQVHRCKKCAV